MKEKLYKILPTFFQNIMISIFNIRSYKQRYGGKYNSYLQQFKKNRKLSRADLLQIQKEHFTSFLTSAKKKAFFYKEYPLVTLDQIDQLPILKKEDLRSRIDEVYTLSSQEGIVSKTGGTTGKSLKVLFTKDNMQERFAMLDDFRNRQGYKLGKKTAWFSGKELLTKRDLKNRVFWKTDYWFKVRYYSTFHIKENYLKYYIDNLIKFQPEYMVGFPSSILEIAKYGLSNKCEFPSHTIKAIFPTAETVTKEMREVIETFFKTKMYDQYASSEGAPFIFECERGNLHLELQSGVFEVLDEQGKPTHSGRLVVTPFATEGTPLIRYDIGDSITLESPDLVCDCGNHNPMVKAILGRIDDYIYSPENGKINLGNVSNTLKDTYGIVRFQAHQKKLNAIEILLMVDEKFYSEKVENIFLNNWRARVGQSMELSIKYVSEIPVEKSGKYRIVKNDIKHLIEKNEA